MARQTYNLQDTAMGYNKEFLQSTVNVPILKELDDAYILDGSEVIAYTHFSLALNKRRKFAIWVAWNIDGTRLRRVSRKGIDFYLDERIPAEFQAGASLYSDNPLDRGHIARRADLLWGTAAEANKANKESFAFTNIAPQMAAFNQGSKGGVWGNLENALYDQVAMDASKVSVMAGCIFNENDQEYRGYQIPIKFFKIILYEEKGLLKAKSFILRQDLEKLDFLDLDAFKTYAATPLEIEEKCGFVLDPVITQATAFEPGQRELEDVHRPIRAVEDIEW